MMLYLALHRPITINPEGDGAPLISQSDNLEHLLIDGLVAQEQNDAASSPISWDPSEIESQMRPSSQYTLEIQQNSELITQTSERVPLLEDRVATKPREHNWGHIKSFLLYNVAEFFGQETPLAQDKRRVRWKCVSLKHTSWPFTDIGYQCCGQRFYHDYSRNSDSAFDFTQDPATEADRAGRAWGDDNEPCS